MTKYFFIKPISSFSRNLSTGAKTPHCIFFSATEPIERSYQHITAKAATSSHCKPVVVAARGGGLNIMTAVETAAAINLVESADIVAKAVTKKNEGKRNVV